MFTIEELDTIMNCIDSSLYESAPSDMFGLLEGKNLKLVKKLDALNINENHHLIERLTEIVKKYPIYIASIEDSNEIWFKRDKEVYNLLSEYIQD
ncbi:hypothetical protein ACNQFZ_08680 [Schinkia sp. CFF1]